MIKSLVFTSYEAGTVTAGLEAYRKKKFASPFLESAEP
jgi:hypothetical protein